MSELLLSTFTCSLCCKAWSVSVYVESRAEFRGVCPDCVTQRELSLVGLDEAIRDYADAIDQARAAVSKSRESKQS